MATVPTPPDFASGISDTSKLNQLRDCIKFLESPPRAELRQTVAQSLPGSTGTALTFTTEDLDTDIAATGGHDNAVNTTRYTAQYAGWYQCSGGVAFSANATGRRGGWWAVNGSSVNGSQTAVPATAASDCEVPARTKHIFLNVSDYVELLGYQESGGALNTQATAQPGSTACIRWVSNQ